MMLDKYGKTQLKDMMIDVANEIVSGNCLSLLSIERKRREFTLPLSKIVFCVEDN